ncbi:MAG: ATP-binding protein [Muribaculaceae bacterium]
MTIPEILSEFDKTDSNKQRLLANRLFDILNEENFFDEPFAIPSNWPTDSLRAEVWLAATIYYYEKQQFREAVNYGNRALPLIIKGDNTPKITDCLSYLSASYARISDYTNAIKLGKKLLEIDRASGDKSAISSDLSNLAFMYIQSNRPKDARKYIIEAINNSTAAGDSVRMAIQMGMASEIFQNLGENEKALEYSNKAYEIDSNAGREGKAAIRLCQMAAAQLAMGRTNSARDNLLKALPILHRTGNIQSYSIACNQLGKIALADNNPALATEYFNKALDFFCKSGDMFNESKSRQGLYEALKPSNVKAALAQLERVCVLKDSLYRHEIQKTTSEYAAKYENEKLSEQQQQLERTLQYKKRENRIVIISAAIILLLAACAIIMLIRLNRVRRQRNEILRHEEQNRTAFFTNITHEFRTPLTVIRGATSHALKHIDDTDIITNDLQAIARHESRLLNLINQLLDIAKLSNGGAQKLPWRHGDVSGYITMLCESCRLYGADRNIAVEYTSEPESIAMDFVPEYIERIVMNLLSNAMKFSHSNGVVGIHTSVKDNNLTLTVHDNGVGIPADEIKHIFKPFHQIANGSNQKGSGLGLPLAALSAKAMNGTIKVESEQNAGTTFIVTLPLASTESVKETFDIKSYHPTTPEFNGYSAPENVSKADDDSESYATRVLIVEDTPDVAKYIAGQMNPAFSYYFAANGKEGLAKAEELVPDIIIADVMMPEMDGFEMTRMIRSSQLLDHIPVIMVTARATHDDRMKGLEAGADAYLEKPFHADELNIRAEKLMEQRRLLQQKFAASLENLPANNSIESTEMPAEPATAEDTLTEREQHDKVFVEKFVATVGNAMSVGKLDYDAIAAELGIGRAQLNRKLKAITGITTKEYILKLRLLKAKNLLLTTDLTVAEITYQCGMEDPGYFSTVFRKTVGVTPMAYRAESRKSNDNN